MPEQIIMLQMTESDFHQAIQQGVANALKHLAEQPPVQYPKYVSSREARELTGWSYDKLEGRIRAGKVNIKQTEKGQPRMILFEDLRPFVKQ